MLFIPLLVSSCFDLVSHSILIVECTQPPWNVGYDNCSFSKSVHSQSRSERKRQRNNNCRFALFAVRKEPTDKHTRICLFAYEE